jgi:phosphohistidine phosphatase
MEIYLVRHGEAESELVDPTQPLRERGRGDVTRVARHATRINVAVAEIRHSTKLRARQTAEILAAHLKPVHGVRETDDLEPASDPGKARDAVEAATESLMLVGHLPHLARLASLLLAGDPNKEIVRFRPGVMARLERAERGWVLGWVLTPDMGDPGTGC